MSEEEPPVENESDGDSDSGAYFLEPTACTVSIAEKVAEANRQLFDGSPACPAGEAEDPKSPKVKFCEALVDFAPEHTEYSTDAESVLNPSEDEVESTDSPHSQDVNLKDLDDVDVQELQEVVEEKDGQDTIPNGNGNDISDVESSEILEIEHKENKLLLVLLPREQSSSCESIIGEENPTKDESETESDETPEIEAKVEKADVKTRPKSAHKGSKNGRSEKVQCKLSPVSPELDCDVEADNRKWHESPKLKQRTKVERSVVREGVSERKNSSDKILPVIRPKTAGGKRSCCVVREDLPKYNGLRSEYGLSAEQLQERKIKSAEVRQKRKQDRQQKLQKDQLRRKESREKFGLWLEDKTSRSRGSSSNSSGSSKVDTLLRSDVYIQNNAIYASKCGVSYAVNYAVARSKKSADIRKKTVNLGKLFVTLSPNAQKTYQIYVQSTST